MGVRGPGVLNGGAAGEGLAINMLNGKSAAFDAALM
jgi:hypothetical protein